LCLKIHVVHPKSYGITESPLKVVHEAPHKVTSHICSSPISMPTSTILLDLLHGILYVSAKVCYVAWRTCLCMCHLTAEEIHER
jgi:hypothetical protein